MLDYLEDGYTEDGYIAAAPGLHNAIEFRYRPLTSDERSTILDKTAKVQTAPLRNAVIREHLVKQIESWSIVDKNGAAMAITVETIKRLKPAVFDKLWDIIGGWAGSQREAADLKN